MTDFAFHRATRQGINPTIGLYAESGNGKTYSALLLARGLAGPTGKIAMVDTESGRGSLYADVIPGGYDVLQLIEPFAPSRYVQALDAIEASGAAVGIIDSCSHEWEGPGGVLDSAGEAEEKSGKGLHIWRKPKFEHAKFVARLQRTPIPLIVCIRAKFKTRQGKDEKQRTCIIKDDHVSPIQAEDFLFELTAHGEILPDHSLRLTKWSHPSLKECFPNGKPITIEHGARVAQWCTGDAKPEKPQQRPAEVTDHHALKKQLWDLMKKAVGPGVTQEKAQQWLWDEMAMDLDQRMEKLTSEQLTKVIDLVINKLSIEL